MRYGRIVQVVWLGLIAAGITHMLCLGLSFGQEKSPSKKGEPLPLADIEKYVEAYNKGTSVQRKLLTEPRRGMEYSGEVRVWDVEERADGSYVITSRTALPHQVRFDFKIEDQTEKKKAERIRKESTIRILGKYQGIELRTSRYLGGEDEYYATFSQTVILSVPKAK